MDNKNELSINYDAGDLNKVYPYLPKKRKKISLIKNILNPESIYNKKGKKHRRLQNLADYREFIKENHMEKKVMNEDCGCGGGASFEAKPVVARQKNDPNIGKIATLVDGRIGKIDDAIRSSTGDVIGYVLTNEKGGFRTFKDNIKTLSESMDGMSSLEDSIGMGEVTPPTADHIGSGDQFPSISSKSGKEKAIKNRTINQFDRKLMDFTDFANAMKTLQSNNKGGKK